MKSGFQFAVLTPPGLCDPSLAIAASRAGELGVLNLEFVQDSQVALDAVVKLSQHARGEFGIKVGEGADRIVADLLDSRPDGLRVVILAAGERSGAGALVESLHRHGLVAVLEATCVEEAIAGAEAGFDAVIAKGHEAGGRVAEECAFVLLQRFLSRLKVPVWVHGGVGLHTAAACRAAGAAGVVLDSQLLLARESPLPEALKAKIGDMDGSETVCIGGSLGEMCRAYAQHGTSVVAELRELETDLSSSRRPQAEKGAEWKAAIRQRAGWTSVDRDLVLVGQDAAFAAPLARRFGTVGRILDGMRKAVDEHLRAARKSLPLDEGSTLAQSHGTRYPIVQGPMTRVSDGAEFALSVAENGALPFLALALMRGPQVRELLEGTRRLLGDRSWGVGILGFVPADLRQEQMEAIHAFRPPFALIAGGRPDQARGLEQEGIATYLHVPSPGLLRLFLRDGARRFVFEGRECGGHVGPRSSFVLWDTLVDVLLEWLDEGGDAPSVHVLFAGGIHGALSSAMVATIAAPLAERGVRVGALLGTGYLFTREAVATGAITAAYQREAIRCSNTVLLESGPGHSTRVAETPYAETFQEKKRELQSAGLPADEIRDTLENMNIGRLRVASKGIDRNPEYGREPGAPEFLELGEEEQRRQGTYMIGQVAALRDGACTMADLHQDVSVEGSQRLRSLPDGEASRAPEARPRPTAMAIIGMACILPGAPDLGTFRENILNKVDAIREVPPERWDWRQYYDPDPKAKDKVYSKWGGFIDDVPFDPVFWGIPPNSLSSIEPIQLLSLEGVRAALEDAGYVDTPFDRERTSVILGAGGGAGDLGVGYVTRSKLPMLFGDAAPDIASGLGDALPDWTEDSFAGILVNVAAGRVANRFDLGGMNCTVDAACASSLAAIHLASNELDTHNSDMVIVGGIDGYQSPFAYLCFSKTAALSPSGRCRPYDAGADGIGISEGVAVVVLKRLEDAERDGDRIYAVIRGVGTSSDGRTTGLTAPHPEGQVRALQRAYDMADVSPAMVGLIEGHGTGTVAGDQAEVAALTRVFDEAGAGRQSCALGSVKSMIGHTKCTAGVAGLIKTALALHHRVLPPTLNVEQPNPRAGFAEGPLYLNTEARPWIDSANDHPRYAGVSAFGFGGTNFHVVVEEYEGAYLNAPAPPPLQEWPSELCIWRAPSREALVEAITPVEKALAEGAQPALRDLAYTLYLEAGEAKDGQVALAVVAGSLDDLQEKLGRAREALVNSKDTRLDDPRGMFFSEEPLAPAGKIAFLFPGQGSQYVDMLRDLAILFPEVRAPFERADKVLRDRLPRPLSSYVFPPPVFTEEEDEANQAALTQANVAQPAMGAANLAMIRLLKNLGVEADLTAGHSYGEFVALYCGGVFNEDDLFALSEARGRFFVEEAGPDPGTMAAVEAGPEAVADLLEGIDGYVVIANLNAPRQTVVSGTEGAVEQVIERCRAREIRARRLSVACGYHSQLVARAEARLVEFLSGITLSSPRLQVFSNTSAARYPSEPPAIAALLAKQLMAPVRFVEEVGAMYEAGARIFVEVGPRGVLAKLAHEILSEEPHLAVASDQPGRAGLTQLHYLLAQLTVNGVPVKLDRLYEGRSVRRLDLGALAQDTAAKPLPPTTWLVNGGRARPLHQSEGETSKKAEAKTPLRITVGGDAADSGPVGVQRASTAAPASLPLPNVDPPVPSGGAADQVMLRFQQLMERFLETQKNIMLSYLQGAPGAGVPGESSPADAAAALPVADSAPAPEAQAAVQPASQQPDAPTESAAQPAEAIPEEPALIEHLVAIVSERTGYPPEMIDLEADLEADLGIDSIKRVEILGTLRLSFALPEELDGDGESLAEAKTLRAIVDLIRDGRDAGPPPDAAPTLPPPVQASPDGNRPPDEAAASDEEIQRFTLRVAEAPAPARSATPATGQLILVTDDETGVARKLADALREQGYDVALVRPGGSVEEIEPGRYAADLTSPRGVARLVETVRRRHGAIGGLVHLLPLRRGAAFDEMDLSAWKDRLQLEVKSLFLLSKALAEELDSAAQEGGAFLVAATGMTGAFAAGGEPGQFFPGHGGVAGFAKTVALEWPRVRVKAIDLNPQEGAEALSGHILAEIMADDGQVEVGYDGARRLILQTVTAPVDCSDRPEMDIDGSWVILVTGGARGITADVARELAERYKPTLLLVGRTPLSAGEDEDTAALTSPHDLKAAIIERMRRAGEQVIPSRVEAVYNRLLREREVRRTLAELEDAGARVHYHQADVCDEDAFGALIDEIYETHGRLDGVIHGAGVIEDKLITDKTPDSFDRVFGTKTESAFTLSRRLRPESLKFLVFFSSVSGRFGNRGQADYAATNEVLNKLAVALDQQWPGRIVAVNWGPWKTGMVSPEAQRQFAERGVMLIPPEIGRRRLDEELRHGRKGEVEVLVGGGWPAVSPDTDPSPAASTRAETLPLLGGSATLSPHTNGAAELSYTLDPARDLYLADHRLDGEPVLPLAMAMELMAEAVLAGAPGLQVGRVTDLRLLRGIVVENGPRPIRVITKARPAPSGEERVVEASIATSDDPNRIYYRAAFELGRRSPTAPAVEPVVLERGKPFPVSVEQAYEDLLFHGPLFQGIKRIDACGPNGLTAILEPSSPETCLAEESGDAWWADPVVIDCALQLQLLWGRVQWDITSLPSRIRTFTPVASLAGPYIRCEMRIQPESAAPTIIADHYLYGADGRLLAVMEGVEFVGSKSLNRVSGRSLPGATTKPDGDPREGE